MNLDEIMWVAGLLEGEGSFEYRASHSPRISCASTDLDVLERIKEYTGSGYIYEQGKQKSHHKFVWVWVVHGKDAVVIMEFIKPHMLKRRSQKIDGVLDDYYNHLKEKQDALINRNNLLDSIAMEYITTDQSYRDLQKKYGMSFVTIYKHVKKMEQDKI